MNTEENLLLEHARQNDGILQVPHLLVQEPAILSLRKTGLLEIDWPHCTDDVVAVCVVGFDR
jgi:hypothetical protein